MCLIPCSSLLTSPTALTWRCMMWLLALVLLDHLGQHGDGGVESLSHAVAAGPGARASLGLGGARGHPVLGLCEQPPHAVCRHGCDLCWWLTGKLDGRTNICSSGDDTGIIWIFRMLCPSSLRCLCRLCVESAGSYNPVCVGDIVLILLSLATTDTESVTRRVSRHHGVMARGCMVVWSSLERNKKWG